jgi:2-keto-4-pentenoate hydratase
VRPEVRIAHVLSQELIAVHEAPRIVSPFSERHPGLTPEAGYAAARALHRHRLALGWKALGRKIGFTNRTLWPRYGVYEPMWGTVYDRTLIHAKHNRASVSLAGLVQPRIEPEICFKLKTIPRSSDPVEILSSIDWMAHSVEIVQCHHPDWKFKIADCTADNGLHGRLVVGAPVPVKGIGELADKLPLLEARLFKGERMIDRGVGANVLGSPLLALAHLVDLLKRQPDAPPLGAGEIITTGVLTDAHPVAAGERWHTELAGLPLSGLKISFE